MSTKKKPTPVVESGSVRLIPLCKLKKSPRNARKTPHTQAEIETLAASIKAHGMIQNPVVEPEFKGKKATGYYLVTAGEGRRLAQLLRAKRKEIRKNEPVRCTVDTTHDAFEISVAENAIRSDMHPADQFEAFFKLHAEHGMNDEDIAARFGVTPAVVRQRLKLAAVSPKLIQLYREGDMNFEQLTAFMITDDHAKQEAVWEALPDYRNDREAILAALTEHHVPAHDRCAIFVGAEAYQAAGGAIIRDLFAEAEDGAYFTDERLLNRLVEEKLQGVADTVKEEGWKWVQTMASFDHGFTAAMRRLYPQDRDLSPEEEARIEALEAEYEGLDAEDDESLPEFDRIEAEIAEIKGEDQYTPEQMASAGAIVTLAHDGEPRIERGFVRPEDAKQTSAKKERALQDGPKPLPEKLIVELTAFRTLGLRHRLAAEPDTALVAVIHALAVGLFYPYAGCQSCLEIKPLTHRLAGHAEGLGEHDATQALEAAHEEWASRMPGEPEALWDWVAALDAESRLRLLAHCAALTVNAVRTPKEEDSARHAHADALARALSLDMRAYWSPTAPAYLGRVSKERILEAVREGVSNEAAENLAAMKKGAMADAAEKRLAQRGWLPSILRPPAEPPLAIAAE